jgi:hypothetical protein
MLQWIENTKEEIPDIDFVRIVKDEIREARNVESIDSENMRVLQLESNPSIRFLLPFPFFVPDKNFRYGSFKYTENGNKQLENGFEDLGVVYGKDKDSETTSEYDPQHGVSG